MEKVKAEELNLKKELIRLQNEAEKEKHLWKMEELEMIKKNEILHHENEMQRQRIKTAEIRKSQMRKFDGGDPFKA